ncbi:hypothetical protein [Micromonospora sp. NBS 11-29]|uniref:hypothetical protein n=1 Tax=Micromonospora sp. NBS 11-29 TaxID=1960879 RepID=UPI000B798E53|nr:hypothetical protein [Micromonospora sp. NBS 11-29]
MLVAFAYLTAGPGTATDRYQLAPYYGALIAVAAGALGSTATTVLPRPAAGDADAVEPTDILAPLPTGVVVASAGGDVTPTSSGAPAPAHWDWPEAGGSSGGPTGPRHVAPASTLAAPQTDRSTPPPADVEQAHQPAPTATHLDQPAPAAAQPDPSPPTATQPDPAPTARQADQPASTAARPDRPTPPAAGPDDEGLTRGLPLPGLLPPGRRTSAIDVLAAGRPGPQPPTAPSASVTPSPVTPSPVTPPPVAPPAVAPPAVSPSPVAPPPAAPPVGTATAGAAVPAPDEAVAPAEPSIPVPKPARRPRSFFFAPEPTDSPAPPTSPRPRFPIFDDVTERPGDVRPAWPIPPAASRPNRPSDAGAPGQPSTAPTRPSTAGKPSTAPGDPVAPAVAPVEAVTGPDGDDATVQAERAPRPRHPGLPDPGRSPGWEALATNAQPAGRTDAGMNVPAQDRTGDGPAATDATMAGAPDPGAAPRRPAGADDAEASGGKSKVRRGLFRRNRDRSGSEPTGDAVEPGATPDEEYVDWVAGLAADDNADDARSLRTGRHHRD